MENIEFTTEMGMLVVVVAGILQQIKKLSLPNTVKNWMPVVALVIAVGLGFVMKIGGTTPETLIASLLVGLVAAGGYDVLKGPKTIVGKPPK